MFVIKLSNNLFYSWKVKEILLKIDLDYKPLILTDLLRNYILTMKDRFLSGYLEFEYFYK